MSLPFIHIVAGATASGKSALAIQLAHDLGGVIINADSQQVYRDLPLLTARPSAADEASIPHRLYGFLGGDEPFSAGKWLRFAQMEIDWARSQDMTPIVVGGTGLYLKALMQGIAEIPAIDEAVRLQSEQDYDAMGREAFSERLRAVDPAFFTRLKVYDKQRLIRAYSVWLGTGKALSFWQQQPVCPPYPTEQIRVHRVELPRAELYARCNIRFRMMVEAGAIDELHALHPLPQ